MYSTNSKRTWEPWRGQESSTRNNGTLGGKIINVSSEFNSYFNLTNTFISEDTFIPTRTESSMISNAPSRSNTQNIAGPPKKPIVQPLLANGSRVLPPPPMSWNGDKGSYQQPSRSNTNSSQRYGELILLLPRS